MDPQILKNCSTSDLLRELYSRGGIKGFDAKMTFNENEKTAHGFSEYARKSVISSIFRQVEKDVADRYVKFETFPDGHYSNYEIIKGTMYVTLHPDFARKFSQNEKYGRPST